MNIKKWIVKNIIRPKWVAFEYNEGNPEDGNIELGISIFGVIIGLYKADTIYPDKVKNVRIPEKREFGESLHPIATYTVK